MKYPIFILFLVLGLTALAVAQPAEIDPQTQAQQAQQPQQAQPDVAPAEEVPTDAAMPDVASDQAETDSTTQPATEPANPAETATNRPAFTRNRNRRSTRRGAPVAMAAIAPTPQPKRMSSAFDIVMNRSIFLKGSQTTTDNGGSARANNLVSSAPERSLVFNGVTEADNAVAMVENTDTHEVLKLHVGDGIARGKVVAISLDSLDYEVDGRISKIGFGETFTGDTPMLTIPGVLASPAATGTTQPAAGGPAARQLGESVEAYLRRRRAMGL